MTCCVDNRHAFIQSYFTFPELIQDVTRAPLSPYKVIYVYVIQYISKLNSIKWISFNLISFTFLILNFNTILCFKGR